MTTPNESRGILIDGGASELAFEAGQILQRELTNRAVVLAENQTHSRSDVLVTTEHIRASVDASLLTKIRIRMGIDSHGGSDVRIRVGTALHRDLR